MKVMAIWPPHIPTYFNAGHRMFLFSTVAYLRRLPEVKEVDVFDAGVLNRTWTDVARRLHAAQPDVILIGNEIGEVSGLGRFIQEARRLCARARLITAGRLSSILPEYFTRYPELDGIVAGGDIEAIMGHYVSALAQKQLLTSIPGLWVKTLSARGTEWQRPSSPGRLLTDLPLPDPRDIPFSDYDRMYLDDRNRFCGISQRSELIAPVARGCPIRCSFCDVPVREGLSDRRPSVSRLLQYFDDAAQAYRYDYVSMYAPTFTLRSRWSWVRELCEVLKKQSPQPTPWKCTTMLSHLDRDLLIEMGKAGCIRVSVGLETLDPYGQATLPKNKRISERRFIDAAAWFREAGVELNCFVIVGLPGTTAKSVAYTRAVVEEAGARFRPTRYLDTSQMRADMTEEEIDAFSSHRWVRATDSAQESHELYNLFLDPLLPVTQVQDRIPQRLPNKQSEPDSGRTD
jgi:Radical SAM superfamily